MKKLKKQILLTALSCILSQSAYSFTNDKSHSVIIGDLDWIDVIELSDDDPIRQHSFAVADVRIPAASSRCTGFLISKNVLMTNNHCVENRSQARGLTAAFKHEKGVLEADWDKYLCDEFIGNDSRLDYALVRCRENPGEVHGFVRLQTEKMEDHARYCNLVLFQDHAVTAGQAHQWECRTTVRLVH